MYRGHRDCGITMEETGFDKTITTHRFLDEAGDTTFFFKGRTLAVGQPGVSLAFCIGMVKINTSLHEVRGDLVALQQQIEKDDYLNIIPSIKKRIAGGGFFFHATDDPPEVRELLYKFIKKLDCSVEVVVARKTPEIFARKHNNSEAEFYADVLSHILKNKLKSGQKFVLNISHRANSTSNKNLQMALEKAKFRAARKHGSNELRSLVVFNVQNHRTEPLLNIADYLCWAVQRVFERGETRYYDFVRDKVSLVIDLYDRAGYKDSMNYYRKDRSLGPQNKISPPSP
jgi:hypothetical protein